MSISPINTTSPISPTLVSEPEKISPKKLLETSVKNELQVLEWLSGKTLAFLLPDMNRVIHQLNEEHISFKECESEFFTAFLNSFTPKEVQINADKFITYFDEYVPEDVIKRLDPEQKEVVWLELIQYYSSEYLGIEVSAKPLYEIFNDINQMVHSTKNDEPLSNEEEETLEEVFDDFIETFLEIDFFMDQRLSSISKLLIVNYLALLISELKKLDIDNTDSTLQKLSPERDPSIHEIMEELYYHLLELPIAALMFTELDNHEKLLAQIHNLTIKIQSEEDFSHAKELFIEHLANVLIEPDSSYDKNVECIKEVFSSMSFLNNDLIALYSSLASEIN